MPVNTAAIDSRALSPDQAEVESACRADPIPSVQIVQVPQNAVLTVSTYVRPILSIFIRSLESCRPGGR
jgi:hypothetical protein